MIDTTISKSSLLISKTLDLSSRNGKIQKLNLVIKETCRIAFQAHISSFYFVPFG